MFEWRQMEIFKAAVNKWRELLRWSFAELVLVPGGRWAVPGSLAPYFSYSWQTSLAGLLVKEAMEGSTMLYLWSTCSVATPRHSSNKRLWVSFAFSSSWNMSKVTKCGAFQTGRYEKKGHKTFPSCHTSQEIMRDISNLVPLIFQRKHK